jgi:sigma-B regulation protein RsbU (phosphoserine phosphatase)
MKGSPRSRILVVDDEPGMLRAVTRILESRHDVKAASTPAEALLLAEQFDPDIAVLDIRMPDMNGFELMRRLRVDRAELDVIMMTGNVVEPEQNLIRAIDEGAFYFVQKPFDRRVLMTLVSRCLELRRLRRKERRLLERMQHELADARRFQQSSLPPAENALNGAAVHARYKACTELAGDLYDYAPAAPGVVAMLIADVSGHGASAAMITGIVKSAFHTAHVDDYAPHAVVERVADGLQPFDAGRFVTLFCGRLNTEQRRLEFVNAGHPPALLQAPGGTVRHLDPTGPLISSGFRDLPWETGASDLEPGERLLLYTDGLLEASGDEGMFGRQRLETVVARSSARGAAFLDDILDAVSTFAAGRPWEDDITLLTVDVE